MVLLLYEAVYALSSELPYMEHKLPCAMFCIVELMVVEIVHASPVSMPAYVTFLWLFSAFPAATKRPEEDFREDGRLFRRHILSAELQDGGRGMSRSHDSHVSSTVVGVAVGVVGLIVLVVVLAMCGGSGSDYDTVEGKGYTSKQ